MRTLNLKKPGLIGWWRGLTAQTKLYLAVIGTFLLGIYGFHAAYQGFPNADQRLRTHVYLAFQLVLGRFPDDLADAQLPAALVLARYLSPALAWWATIQAVWQWIRNPLRLAGVSVRGNHLVILGDEGLARRIAAGERKRGGRVIIWPENPKSGWVQSALDLGAPHVSGSVERKLKALKLSKARMVVVAAKDEAWNLEQCSTVLHELDKFSPKKMSLPVILRIDDPDLAGPVERRLKRIAGTHVELRLISLPDVEARRLFLDRPLDRLIRSSSGRHSIFIFGASAMAERYLLRVLSGVHFRFGTVPAIVIFDPRSEQARDTMFARTPALARLEQLMFVKGDIERPALIPAILESAVASFGLPSSIIVDPATPSRGMAIAAQAAHFFWEENQPAPFIYFRALSSVGEGFSGNVCAFGTEAIHNDPEVLLQEKKDRLARAIHASYFQARLKEGELEGSRQSMYSWDRLPAAVRDENRLTADLFELKLRDIGARVLDGNGASFRLSDIELEQLAKAEHRCWVSSKLLTGWTYGSTRDDEQKRHPDLRPYDELSEQVKNLDREQVLNLIRLFDLAGKRVVRDLLIEADDIIEFSDVADRLRQTSTTSPDRQIVLIGDFHDAQQRGVMIAADAAGYPVQIQLRSNPDRVIDAASNAEAQLLRRLVRNCDRIYVQ